MKAEPSITIGDIRDICQDHYEATQARLTFSEALQIAFSKYPVHSPCDIPQAFMEPDQFQSFIDELNIMKLERKNTVPSQTGANRQDERLIDGRQAFDASDGVTAYIHIPYIGDDLHTHGHFEINYIYRGHADVAINERELLLKEGDLFILAPNSAHSVQTAQNDIVISIELRLSPFGLLFQPIFCRENALSQFFQESLNGKGMDYILYHTGASGEIQALIQHLIVEEYIGDSESVVRQIGGLFLLFSNVNRAGYGFETGSSRAAAGKEPNLSQILSFIKTNYQTVTLEMLSEKYHYSVSFLSKFIQKQTGKSYRTLLQDYKLERGRELLSSTEYSIEEICGLIGYESISHFYRIFKVKYGVSPRTYRERSSPK